MAEVSATGEPGAAGELGATGELGAAARAVSAAGDALAAAAARFASLGWMRGTSGNVSLVLSSDPLRLAVTASGRDKGELTAADVVVVDADGRAVAGG